MWDFSDMIMAGPQLPTKPKFDENEDPADFMSKGLFDEIPGDDSNELKWYYEVRY